jgi:peptide deformylase
MAELEIRLMGDPVLRERSHEVESIDDPLRRLAQDMFDTMYAADGVGLAAPQVGELLRLIVVDTREPEHEPVAVVNPRIVRAGPEPDRAEEGCLSIPGLRDVVERPESVVVEGLDLQGREVRFEARGLLARVFQHEIDHLDGVLFLDRLSPLKRKMLLRRWEKTKPHGEPRGGL